METDRPTGMRKALILAFVLGALIGCTGGKSPVIVRGTLEYVGGPPIDGQTPHNPAARIDLRFVPAGAHGSRTSVTTGVTGGFSVRLVPGTYRLSSSNGSVFAVGQLDQSLLTVTTQGPNQFQLIIPIP
jgi:hypothetical protein